MNKLNHTPGPWRVRARSQENPTEDFFVTAPNNNKSELGYGIEIMGDDCGEHNGYPKEQKFADAVLIATAPNMLKAINDFVNDPLIQEIMSDASATVPEVYELFCNLRSTASAAVNPKNFSF